MQKDGKEDGLVESPGKGGGWEDRTLQAVCYRSEDETVFKDRKGRKNCLSASRSSVANGDSRQKVFLCICR